jgi:hypothetical protein
MPASMIEAELTPHHKPKFIIHIVSSSFFFLIAIAINMAILSTK